MAKELLYWLGLICHFASIGTWFLTRDSAPALPMSWLASSFFLLSRLAGIEQSETEEKDEGSGF